MDEQRNTRMLLRASLRELGYREIIEASDGEHALLVLAKQQIDLILAELEMSKLDGLKLLQAVRDNPRFKTLPFVLLTARADASVVNRAKQIGVTGILAKPFAPGC